MSNPYREFLERFLEYANDLSGYLHSTHSNRVVELGKLQAEAASLLQELPPKEPPGDREDVLRDAARRERERAEKAEAEVARLRDRPQVSYSDFLRGMRG